MTNHGVDETVIERLWRLTRAFHAQPAAAKTEFAAPFGLTLSSALSYSSDSVRRHRPSTKSLRPTSAFRWANCTALLAGILLATSELATVPRATCEAQVNMVSLLG